MQKKLQRLHKFMSQLIDNNQVSDYCLSIKNTSDNKKIIIAYLVSHTQFDFSLLEQFISKEKNLITDENISLKVEIKICEVNHIPKNKNGEINYLLLENAPILEQKTIDDWENLIRKKVNIENSAVLLKNNFEKKPPFHLLDITSTKNLKNTLTFKKNSQNINNNEKNRENLNKKNSTSCGKKIASGTKENATLELSLQKIAKQYPYRGIHFVEDDDQQTFQSYSQLLEEATIILGGLQEQGLKPGDFTILQISNIKDHFSAFWGCVLGGIIPVTVSTPSNPDDTSIIEKLNHTIDLLPGSCIIASDGLAVSQDYMPLNNNNTKILNLSLLKQSQRKGNIYSSSPEDVLFQQLTSGSTGNSKCVQITHKGVIAHIKGIAEFNQYSDKDVSLNWLPLDHVAPILMFHLKDLYLGIEQIVVKTEVVLAKPLKWLEYMEKFKATHSWAPNFGFKLVNDALLDVGQNHHFDLHHVIELMNAGEQTTFDVIKDFLHLTKPFGISDKVIQPASGMAETCTAITYRNDFDLSKKHLFHTTEEIAQAQDSNSTFNKGRETIFIDLGLPIPGVEMRITNKQGEIVNEGEIGHLHVRGDVITPGYLNNPEANAEVFFPDNWFDTGDMGFIKNGSLTLTGREKETIIIQGANFYNYDIETIVETVAEVANTFVAACGVIDPQNNIEVLAIFFCLATYSENLPIETIQQIRKAVSVSAGISPKYIIPLDKSRFPKTTSGKIQRGRLKQLFESGEFTPIVKALDIQLRNENTLPQWFFKRQWHNHRGHLTVSCDVNDVIIFATDDTLSQSCIQVLHAQKRHVIQVYKGDQFTIINDHTFTINPKNKSDFTQLIELTNKTFRVSHIIYNWSGINQHQPPSELKFEDINLVYLCSALTLCQSVYLFILSNQSQYIENSDQVKPHKALIPGIIRTIQQENKHIHTRHIDLDNRSATDARYILNEMLYHYSPYEVAYRNGQRKVAGLESVNLNQSTHQSATIQHQGFYIVSGGLGGIGFEVCRFLLQDYDARLLIIGRSPQEQAMASNKFLALKKISPYVSYYSCTLDNESELRQVVNHNGQSFQQSLAGVFHLAGNYHPIQLADENLDTIEQNIAVKVHGSYILSNLLLEQNPMGLFVSFSSIFSFCGGSAVGIYAAANRFLESLTLSLRQSTPLHSFCFSWSNWDNMGMSEGYKNIQALGYEAISSKQGIDSLKAALHSGEPLLFIGLDSSRTNVSVHLNNELTNTQKLVHFYTKDNSDEVINFDHLFDHLDVTDCLGTKTFCEHQLVESLPVTATGEIDRQALSNDHYLHTKGAGPTPASTAHEESLLALWRHILKTETIGIHDNFFEIGGNSLSMTVLLGEMSQQFAREFTMADFFKYPTIATMAQHITPQKPTNKANEARKQRLQKRLQLQRNRQIS